MRGPFRQREPRTHLSRIDEEGRVTFRLATNVDDSSRSGAYISVRDLTRELDHFARVLREGEKERGVVYSAPTMIEMVSTVVHEMAS